MRGVRRVRRHREWEVDGEDSFPHAPDAEATPMISQPNHWNSFFPRNATDRQHLSTRIKQGMVTPAFTAAIRSIRRLFGRGPIPVSRVAVPETFDIESSDDETNPFDTLRSNASKAKHGPFTHLRHNAASGSDRGASSYTLTHPSDGTRDSTTIDGELDSDRGLDQGVANGVGGSNGADDHDSAGDCVMLITRNGQDFSSGGSLISLRGDRSPIESDRRSTEVVPPTPTLDRRVSTFNNAMTRTRWLTIMLSAFLAGRLPFEKCLHTSSSVPLRRLSPTTLVLPLNQRFVKPWRSTASTHSFLNTVCFRGPFTPLRQGRPSFALLHVGGTAHRPCGKAISSPTRHGTRPYVIPSNITQPAHAPRTWCLLPSPLATSAKLHAVVSRTVAPGFSIRPSEFGAIEPDQRVRPTIPDPARGAWGWLQSIPAWKVGK